MSKDDYSDSLTTSDTVRERLNHLHDSLDMSWRRIADLEEYKGIPAGTLCSFAAGWEPKGYKSRMAFGLGPSHSIECPNCDHVIGYYVSDLPCPYCNSYFIEGHDDHIIPRAQDGPDEEWNIVLCCRECNLGKNNRHPWEWLGDEWEPDNFYKEQFQKVAEFLDLPKPEFVRQFRGKKGTFEKIDEK